MISVILPTIRPHLVQRALSSIVCAADRLQVIVIADFDFDPALQYGPVDLLWVYCPERRGVIDAINIGYERSKGDWIFITNDETTLGLGYLDTLWDAAQNDNMQLYAPRHEPTFNFSYYGRQFAPFPFVHRKFIRAVGGLFDTAYKGFYADPDFSLRVLEAGYPIHIVQDAAIAHHQDHDLPHAQAVSKYLDADRALFRSRWDKLGTFADPT